MEGERSGNIARRTKIAAAGPGQGPRIPTVPPPTAPNPSSNPTAIPSARPGPASRTAGGGGAAPAASWSRAAYDTARRDLDTFLSDPETIARTERVTRLLADMYRRGGKLLLCGNGGSACDAAHAAEELTGRYRADRPPLGAIACTDAGHITCTANDYGFEEVFARWVRALGRPGDAIILLSTSGNSANVVRAADAAREIGVRTIALLGKGGGTLRERCDESWIVPGATADRIQELHMLVLHVLIEGVERELWPTLYEAG